MGLLEGKRLLITGVLTEASIAYTVAKLAQEQGADVVLSGFGRGLGITERIAKRLPEKAPVIELDVTSEEDLAALPQRLADHVDGLDGVLHAIAFAPEAALGGNFMTTQWPDVATAVQVSAFSLAALTRAVLPILTPGSGVVGLDFDATVAWPAYDWMGVAKAGLESTARYLARHVGANRDPGEPGRRRALAHHCGEVDRRLRGVRAGLGRAGPARLGHPRYRSCRSCLRRVDVRLVPGHDG